MAISKGMRSISSEDILNKVKEFDILSYYIGISSIPCVINSPLRVDNHPSFGLWSLDGIHIGYTDLATKETGDTFTLLEKLWNLDYWGVLNKIYTELPNIKNNNSSVNQVNKIRANVKTYKKDTILECKVRQWKQHDIDYWEQYGISKKWLIFGEIYPISHIIITKDSNRFAITAEKYAYSYVERKDGILSLKIYQPFSEKFKWSNKHDGSVWDLWTKIPETGEELIITSSRKDALCIWENTNIPTLSLQAESYLPKPHVVQQLKDRYKNIYVLYDNDFNSPINYGEKLGESMAKEFDLIQLKIPTIYKSKDISDLCKNYNRATVKKVILNLIKESKQINENS